MIWLYLISCTLVLSVLYRSIENKKSFYTFAGMFIWFNVVVFYFIMPTINLYFTGINFLMIVNLLFSSVISFKMIDDKFKEDYYANKKDKKTFFSKHKTLLSLAIIPLSIVFILILSAFISTSSIFHSERYFSLLNEKKVEISTLSEKISDNVKISNMRTVDQKLAEHLAEKRISSIASTYSVGEMNIQKVKDQTLWVAPLEYKGFFKWLGKDYSVGYITVNAYNESDIKVVKKINGKDLKMKYLKNSYFNENLNRYLYMSGFSDVGLTDYTFEINDEGVPYYVVSVYEKTIGISGSDTVCVIIVDVQTGEIQYFKNKDVPNWVDRIQPEHLIREQLTDWGQYADGYWNSVPFSSQNNVLAPTYGTSLIEGKNGETYWYTGMKAVNGEDVSVGFALINTKTKEFFWYKKEGATENEARRSAEGTVSEKNYSGTNPIAYNINGEGVYFLTLKDNSQVVKMYAFVSIHNLSITGLGSTISEAYNNFLRNLSSKVSGVYNSDYVLEKIIQKQIKHAAQYIENGNSYMLFQIINNNSVFAIPIQEVPASIFLNQNSIVSFEYNKNSVSGIIHIQSLKIKWLKKI